MIAIFVFLITMLIAVGFHELGHAIAAKLFSIKIKRISLGFGKPLLTWRMKNNLEWTLASWPLGGYVNLLNSRITAVTKKEEPFCFDKKPVWIRCIVLLAGSFTNLLIALLAFTFFFMYGYSQRLAVIETVATQSIAAKANLEPGDRFIALAGRSVVSWQEFGMQLIMQLGKDRVAVTLMKPNHQKYQTTFDLNHLNYQETSLLASLGIKPNLSEQYKEQVKGLSFPSSLKQAVIKTSNLLQFFIIMLKQIVTKTIPFSVLMGPIGLLASSVNSFLQGLSVFLYFIASLSLAVGLVNLLPIPGLDGGSIAYAIVEKLRGKPASVALEVLLHRLAFIALIIILIQLVLNDLQHFLAAKK